jgi:hypothetical protein
MTPIQSFSLQRHPDQPGHGPHCDLLWNHRPVGLVLQGAVMEAQFSLPAGGYLLLVTDDCPFEEGLHIYLLNAWYELVEQDILGCPYTAAIVENVKATGDNVVTFSFIGDHQVTVYDQPQGLGKLAGNGRLKVSGI